MEELASSIAGPTLQFDIAWLLDPTAWVGLLTLTVIQTVLGIDNLLFIAILSAKLPPKQAKQARYLGLGGALVIRIILMLSAAYIVAISKPLFTIYDFECTSRDLMMLAGGLFLIYKATQELHGKLEAADVEEAMTVNKVVVQSFAVVVSQIIILDVLFSADAIVTAIGMTNHGYIMIISVTIASVLLIWASGAISEFVTKHPTLVILCLGFLLLIAFSLILEAFHIYVSKGYLYSAMGFSILIESFNQISRKNLLQLKKNNTARQTAATIVLRLLGSRPDDMPTLKDAIISAPEEDIFNSQEQEMVSRVLQLSTLPVKAVMTARPDLQMIKIDGSTTSVIKKAMQCTRSRLIAYKNGFKDQPLGFIVRANLLGQMLQGNTAVGDIERQIVQPIHLPETISILKALEQFKKNKKYFGFVFDEFGVFEGVVTLQDILEEITGEMPSRTETPEILPYDESESAYRVDGDTILSDLERETGLAISANEHYQTIAGYVLDRFQRVPKQGEKLEVDGWTIEVSSADLTSINVLKLTRNKPKDGEEEEAETKSQE